MDGAAALTPEGLAAELHAADERAVPVTPLSERWPEMTIADAYAVQRCGRELRIRRGASLVGHKVGLTSAAMQDMLGVDQPDFGYITDRMLFTSAGSHPASRLIAPLVEAEIAFRLRAPLVAGASIADVLEATESVAPALEVIDSRVIDWRITITDTIADNASSAFVVIGQFVPVGDLDLAAVEATLVVSDADGEESVTGSGSAVLGHPAKPLAWLADALSTYGGEVVNAGAVVLPGAMARAVAVRAGATARATFSGLGTVEFDFTN